MAQTGWRGLIFSLIAVSLVLNSDGSTTLSPQQMTNLMVEGMFGGDSHLTPEEWQQAWRSFDNDGDGRITVQEFEANDRFAATLGEHGAQAIFNFYDKSPGQADGEVLLSDSIYTFRFLDINDDGVVTEGEARHQFPLMLEAEAKEAELLG